MKKQQENSHEGITWSEMGKQNVKLRMSIAESLSGVSQKPCPKVIQ